MTSFGVVALLLGIGHGQGQLQFGEFAVGGGQHQKDEDHQQHVDERDQVDLGLILRTGRKFMGIPPAYLRWRRMWRTNCSDASSRVSR